MNRPKQDRHPPLAALDDRPWVSGTTRITGDGALLSPVASNSEAMTSAVALPIGAAVPKDVAFETKLAVIETTVSSPEIVTSAR